MSRKSKLALVLGFFVLLIVAARVYAEHFVLQYVNKTLDDLDGYHGHVDDIDLHIYRGAYEIENVQIEREEGKTRIPFVAVEKVDISVQWAALFEGSIVAEIDLLRPQLNFVAEKKKDEKTVEPEKSSNWQQQVKDLVPLKINHIGIRDGEIHYRDPMAKPKVDVYVKSFTGRLSNLTNSEDLSETLAATAQFRGVAMGSGQLSLNGKVDPYAAEPTFNLTAEVEDLEVKQLNDFLQAYANVDAESGTISVYTEIDCEKGRFKGYVKPFLKELKLLRWKDEKEGFFGKLWEAIAQGAVKVLENDPKDQVATRIPFQGKLENPEADIGTTVLTLLRNAFIQALQAGIDRSLGGGEQEGIDADKDGDQDQKSAKKDGDKEDKKDKGDKEDKGDERASRRD